MLPLLTKKENSIYFDRIIEFCQFFDIGYVQLNKIITRFGVPDQPVFRKNIFKGFDKIKDTEIKIFYKGIAKLHTLRLLMKFEREKDIFEFEQLIDQSDKKMIVLDYGCGVSDLGLVAASKGCNVTICDLNDKKFDFARWRYERNSLKVETIPINNPIKLPELKENSFDMILVADVMKQVLKPVEHIAMFYRVLRPGGLLFCNQGNPKSIDLSKYSTNPNDKWSVTDQIDSSLRKMNNKEYATYFNNHFTNYETNPQNYHWWLSKKSSPPKNKKEIWMQ